MGGAPSADGRTIIAGRDGWPEAPADTDATPRRRAGLWVALAVLVFAAAGAGGWWFTTQRAETNVPSVAGLTKSAAVRELRADGFTVRRPARSTTTTSRPDP